MVGILGANSVRDSGYNISNSLMFDAGSSAHLSRTLADSNERTWTWSGWFKNCIGANELVLLRVSPDDDTIDNILVSSSGTIQFQIRRAPNNISYINTNQVLRDPSAWYHLVVAYDVTQSTNTDRVKIYLNGNQITSFQSSSYPDQNYDAAINGNSEHVIGEMRETGGAGTRYSDFYLTETHFIDGTAKAQTDFGEFNDNGVWIPIKYTGTYGTNGFYLEFQQTGTSANSSGIGADTSGQDNHFTSSGLAATDVTTDTCTNNFATMNPLDNFYSAFTFSEGNCKFLTDGADTSYNTATIGDLTQGKWYFEIKYTDPAHSNDGGDAGDYFGEIGAIGQKLADTNSSLYPSSQEHNFAYSANNGRIKSNNTAGTEHGSQISNDGQIIGFLLDLDNNRVTTHKDGQYADGSGNHDESFGNAAFVSITAPASTPLGGYFIGFGESKGASDSGAQNTGTYEINFGNPTFAISSGNTDSEGHGNFEFAVPSGYFALCTKNLAEYG